MEGFVIKELRGNPEYCDRAADWFFRKWGIPEGVYRESIQACIAHPSEIPQWYIVLDDHDRIIAGVGVIDNDFHDRRDLSPNLCALFVDESCRRRGIARSILDFVRRDLVSLGVERLYLVTEHTDFYERCGWEYLTNVTGDDGVTMRMYSAPTLE